MARSRNTPAWIVLAGLAAAGVLAAQDRDAEIARLEAAGVKAMHAKRNLEAELHFTELLRLDPTRARISYYLGNVVLGQANPRKTTLALFCFFRAAVYRGPNALPEKDRNSVDNYVIRVYEKYTGSIEGLGELKALAAKQALPPPDLHIRAKSSLGGRAIIHRTPSSRKSRAYADFKRLLLEGEAWPTLHGKLAPVMAAYVVGPDSPERLRRISLSETRNGVPEVELALVEPLHAPPELGDKIEFEGRAAWFTPSPFLLGLEEGRVFGPAIERSDYPFVHAFLDLREALTGRNGALIWNEFQGRLTPELGGFVVQRDSGDQPARIVLSSSPGGAPEVVLRLKRPGENPPQVGDRVVFEGVAERFDRSPFRLELTDGKLLEAPKR